MKQTKQAVEAIIKAERALEAAMIKLMSVESTFSTLQDRSAVEFIQRERLSLDKAQTRIMSCKARLVQLFANREAEQAAFRARPTSSSETPEEYRSRTFFYGEGKSHHPAVRAAAWKRIKKPTTPIIVAMLCALSIARADSQPQPTPSPTPSPSPVFAGEEWVNDIPIQKGSPEDDDE